ncbi:hypothetical protein COBT_001399 [Conglomerata obtusa]
MTKKNKDEEKGKTEIMTVKVIPNMPVSRLVRREDDLLLIELKASPHKGCANHELIKFLAELFYVSRGNIRIVSGMGGRMKIISVLMDNGLDIDEIIRLELLS